VGRLSPEKGVDTLLAAFGQLRNGQAVLSIVGDDTTAYAKQLKEDIPEEIRNRVVFHGFQNAEQVNALYERSFCFVVPSVWFENQPNTVLEGMSHGRPAMVSDLGSLREMVEDGVTGYRFEASNARDLASKLDRLLSDPRRAHEMGLRGRDHVVATHALHKHLASMDELFQRCRERINPDEKTRIFGRQ